MFMVNMSLLIGAAFGFKRHPFAEQAQPHLAHQVIQYVVVQIAQPGVAYLQHHVTITEVIGGARQQQRAVGKGGGNLFGRGMNLYQQTPFRTQHIVLPEHGATRQSQRSLPAIVQTHALTALSA